MRALNASPSRECLEMGDYIQKKAHCHTIALRLPFKLYQNGVADEPLEIASRSKIQHSLGNLGIGVDD